MHTKRTFTHMEGHTMKFRDRSRTVGWWAATVLLFAFLVNSTLAAPVNVTITSTGGTLTLGSDTIQVAGITNILNASLQPNTNTPILTQPPFTFTASTATTNGGYHAFLTQTFTVNGVTTTRFLLFRLEVFPSGDHLLELDVLPASFKLPQGDVFFPPSDEGFFTFYDFIAAPGVTNLPAADENWLLYPPPSPHCAFNISISFPATRLGGLIGNLAGGLDPIQTNLTPNVPASLIYTHYSGYQAIPPFSGGGVSTSVVQTITVNGVSTNIIRTLSLTLENTNIATCPGVDTFLSISPATVTLDLGVSGKLDLILPGDVIFGENPGANCSGPGPISVVPGVLFPVLLHDVPPCVVTCPDDITVSNTPGDCGVVVDYVVPTSCTCDPLFGTPPPGSFFPIGTNTVTVGAGTNGCSFHVTVKDAELPTISCPGNLALSTDAGQCSRSNVTYTVTFGDNCPGAVLTQTAGLPSGSTFPKGTTVNGFTVTDTAGNTNSCSFSVTINNDELPTINCPGDLVLTTDPGQCSRSNVTYSVTSSDSCPGAAVTQTAGLPSGSTFPKGTTINSFMVSNASGNSNTCSFTVTINDNELPTLNCPGNLTFSTDLGQCSRSNVTYTVTFGDNCPGAVLAQTAGLPSGSTFPKGTTVNGFTVTDAAGNTNSCSFSVTINNNELPTINCPGDLVLTTDPGQCSRSNVTYSVTSSDSCPGAAVTQTAGLPSGSTFPKGTTINSFMVSNASGNSNTCSFTVTINDNELPTLNCPGNLTFSTDLGQCSRSNVTYTVTFGDNCPGAVLTQTAGLPGGSTFPKGTTVNRFTVTDASGNTNTCSFTVTINDTQPPTIVCPANIVVNAAEGETSAGVGFPAPGVTDNCPGVNASYSPASGSAFSLGTTTVTLNATDAAGNTNACTFTVTVNPTGGGGLVAEFVTSPMVLNRQTGLFEQSVRLKNLSGATVNASRVYVLGLPSTNSLYNRSGADIPAGSATPSPFVQYNQPLAAGSNVVFLLEFYLSNLKAVTNHTLLPEEVAPANPPSLPDGAQMVPLEPGRNPLQLTNGRFLIEWASIPGRTYLIQYSGDLTNWKTVVPSIMAGGTAVQWVDDGPPKTETNPNQAGNRYYRVFLLPAN